MSATSRLRAQGLHVDTPEGRPLFRDLGIELGRERVALVGRNGVGKSTLLEVLAGHARPARGSVVTTVPPRLVRQTPDPSEVAALARGWLRRMHAEPRVARAWVREAAEVGLEPLAMLVEAPGLSLGQRRKLSLVAAKVAGEVDPPGLLLLDEPTRDLDEAGVAWLLRWIGRWPEGLVVVSHDRRVLRSFDQFVVIAESGCRAVPGSFDALEASLEREDAARQRRYVAQLDALTRAERHDDIVQRRRRRKKNVGRLHELRRCTSRARLNEKRSYAQESQARQAKISQARIGAARDWAQATRRALAVTLPLDVLVPSLGEPEARPLVELHDVGVVAHGRPLFHGLSLSLGRERVAVLGPNGAGKTTLLRTLLGERTPTTGLAEARAERLGSIAQGATDWDDDDDLLTRLLTTTALPSLEAAAQRLLAHRFPLALAQRPLRSLSPGERVRAALLCLMQRDPAVELLVLDEPTDSLDFLGAASLRRVLAAWPGGLVVASHDREFLAGIGIDRFIELDGHGGHHLR